MRLRGGAVIAIGLASLAVAATAQAAQRYAAPGGSGPKTECAQGNPCSLKDAVEGADNNDEVIVTAGTYPLGEQLIVPPEGSNVDIHGDFGGPMPRVTASTPGAVLGVNTPDSRIRYLEVVNEAPESPVGFLCYTKTSIERVVARVSGKTAAALRQLQGCTVRDSLLLADGQGAIALRSTSIFPGYTGIARNVTALATGPESAGVVSRYETPGPETGAYELDLRNSIVAGDSVDIVAIPGLDGPGNVVVAHSNFDRAQASGTATVLDAGSNQTAPPVFVNPAGGNYSEAAGSPTIDAGIADHLGPLDLAGNARGLGSAPDIGAYEFVPPPVVPLPVGQIQSLSVTPRKFGAVNAGGAIVSARKKAKAPIATTVTYSLSAAATVTFSLERRLPGRKVGKLCAKQTKANRTKKKCSRFKPVKGSFTHSGTAGSNTFKFSGRLNGKSLKPGSYRLVGTTGSVSKTATFAIVR